MSEDTILTDNIFDDLSEEDLSELYEPDESETPQTEEEVVEEDKTEETPETPEEESVKPFLEIKFNHEMKGLSQEEARELAQKGMNYDRFYGELDTLARMNGMNVSDYINSLKQTQERFEVSKVERELKRQYPNADPDMLKELATMRFNEQRSRKQQEEVDSRAKSDQALREEMERQLDVFEKHYPNVDAGKLDPKVISYMSDGYTILEAYTLWKNEMEAKQKTIDESKARVTQKNEENKRKSFGNTSNVGDAGLDDFLSGWNSL